MASSLFLIVGLGNPGDKYHHTRHNIGFMFIDYLAHQEGNGAYKSKMQGLFCKVRLYGKQALLLKPQTYMNRSGECVRKFTDYFDIAAEKILIIHDDIDLPFGRIKAVAKGGPGGHNGIRSVAKHLQSQNISRLKVGVGRPQNNEEGSGQPVDKYVLSQFTRREQDHISDIYSSIDDGVGFFINHDIDVCMNNLNGRVLDID